ncbi:TPA: dihydrofolate reductase [Candidatus Saccharibacteria bacterium]|nr:dihydrofolate reductase [Candidatus Saccharibacteria bacterium]HRK40854.1 dihydrofolate reductase [Candidatus Saccharibacteria bacterium]
MINIVVAYDRIGAIGKDGDLPWQRELPCDLAHFKQLTLGHTVVMGRTTWESLPSRFRPLPERQNIVLSHNSHFQAEGALCVQSLAQAIKAADSEVFVIGGARVYEAALPITDRIYATEVHEVFQSADTFFPLVDDDTWVERSRESHQHDDPRSKDRYNYDIVIYDRRN